MNASSLLLTAGATGSGSMGMITIVYVVLIAAFFYFFLLRPQKKEQKQKEALLAQLSIGSSVLTTSGFYGIIIDMTDDTVIVEFGNNKNCRIPMQKAAIVQVENPEDAIEAPAADDKKADKAK